MPQAGTDADHTIHIGLHSERYPSRGCRGRPSGVGGGIYPGTSRAADEAHRDRSPLCPVRAEGWAGRGLCVKSIAVWSLRGRDGPGRRPHCASGWSKWLICLRSLMLR
jgi:hypothetical protein